MKTSTGEYFAKIQGFEIRMSESESEEGFVVAKSTEGFVDVASSSLRKRAANLLLDDKYSGRVLQPGDLR